MAEAPMAEARAQAPRVAGQPQCQQRACCPPARLMAGPPQKGELLLLREAPLASASGHMCHSMQRRRQQTPPLRRKRSTCTNLRRRVRQTKQLLPQALLELGSQALRRSGPARAQPW